MPRPRKSSGSSSPRLSPGQASYVLDRLISERRVAASEIARYVGEMHSEVSTLEQRLASLRAAIGGGSSSASSSASSSSQGTGRRRGRPPGSGKKRSAAASGASKASAGTGTGTGRRRGRPRRNAGAEGQASGSNASSESQQSSGAKRGRGGRTRSAITPEQLASRQLQGRYLALIRQIPASRRAQFQKLAKEKGREAAIKEMSDAVKK